MVIPILVHRCAGAYTFSGIKLLGLFTHEFLVMIMQLVFNFINEQVQRSATGFLNVSQNKG